ncbi:protein tyrosine phosphatase [Agrobacterium sp. ATCC 31749]|nr:protein tyrosine phosphatase [Agrobacterium sp. ATCC 31749]
MDFVPVLFGAQLKQVRQIVFVHGEDEVEGLEISPRHLSCPLSGNIDAVSPRHGDRSRIGCVARMPAAGAGGINGDPVGHAFTIGEVSQNPFGKRRAADIAHADEKNGDMFHERCVDPVVEALVVIKRGKIHEISQTRTGRHPAGIVETRGLVAA